MSAKYKNAENPIKRYLVTSRTPLYGYFIVIPLLVLYEALAIQIQQTQMMQIRNGADLLLKKMIEGLGIHGMFAASLLLVGSILLVSAIVAFKNRVSINIKYFAIIIIESAVLALLLGVILSQVSTLFSLYPETELGLKAKALLSVGAGVYEELIFRVIILSGFFMLMHYLLRFPVTFSFIVALLISAGAFAVFHYLGPGGEVFQKESFVFRLIAGCVFGVLYILRGFGVAVYTHAFYDLYLLM